MDQNLIICLIQQDMKHQQLVSGICNIGFETEIHYSGMLNIVAELMGHPATAVPDSWAETYMEYLGRAEHYPITHRADSLRCLAQDCYTALRG